MRELLTPCPTIHKQRHEWDTLVPVVNDTRLFRDDWNLPIPTIPDVAGISPVEREIALAQH